MYTAALVHSSEELLQIAALSRSNLKYGLTQEEKDDQGFLTWEYTYPVLEKMHAIAPTVIVKYGEDVAGYAITATKEMKGIQPELGNMIAAIEELQYNGSPIALQRYYIMGQICVAKTHRGKGVFDLLYQKHKGIFDKKYDILVTEISTSNYRSQAAHERTGFTTIHTYRDNLDEWNVVVWEINK